MTKQFVSIGITPELKNFLDSKKLCRGESYDELIRRLMGWVNGSESEDHVQSI